MPEHIFMSIRGCETNASCEKRRLERNFYSFSVLSTLLSLFFILRDLIAGNSRVIVTRYLTLLIFAVYLDFGERATIKF